MKEATSGGGRNRGILIAIGAIIVLRRGGSKATAWGVHGATAVVLPATAARAPGHLTSDS